MAVLMAQGRKHEQNLKSEKSIILKRLKKNVRRQKSLQISCRIDP